MKNFNAAMLICGRGKQKRVLQAWHLHNFTHPFPKQVLRSRAMTYACPVHHPA